MSVVDAVGRVQQIRTQLGLDAVRATGSASTGEFAAVLSGVTTGDGAASTAGWRDGSAGSGLPGGARLPGGAAGSGAAVVADARRYLGIPYVFGSNDPANGLDCSGLVQRAYGDLGIKMPRVAADQARMGQEVRSLAEARPGDLVAFNKPVNHIGIYAGDGMMIVAPHAGDKVKLQRVYETPSTIRRIIADPPAALTTAAVRPAALRAAEATGAMPYGDLFTAAGSRHGVSPALLAAVAKIESGYRANAVSPDGAQGLMQLMPSTAAGLGVNPLDPAQAIDGAARLLARHLRDFGSLPLALAAYNAGPGAVHKHGGVPPYAETQGYVRNVQAAMAAFNTRGFA